MNDIIKEIHKRTKQLHVGIQNLEQVKIFECIFADNDM